MADDLSPYREQMFALYLRITPRRGVAKLAAQLVRQYIKPDHGRAVVLEALSYALKVEVDVVVKPRDMPTLVAALHAWQNELSYHTAEELAAWHPELTGHAPLSIAEVGGLLRRLAAARRAT